MAVAKPDAMLAPVVPPSVNPAVVAEPPPDGAVPLAVAYPVDSPAAWPTEDPAKVPYKPPLPESPSALPVAETSPPEDPTEAAAEPSAADPVTPAATCNIHFCANMAINCSVNDFRLDFRRSKALFPFTARSPKNLPAPPDNSVHVDT